MEGSVVGGGPGGAAGRGTLGPPRPHSAPLVKVVPAGGDPLSDVITTPLNDVINSSDVTLPAPVVGLPPGAGPGATLVLKEDTTSPTTTTLLHGTPSTTSSTSTLPPDSKATTTFEIEPNWTEAACKPVLSVRCKKTIAELVKSKFGSGSRGKCIRLGKEWFTPTEFEAHCGRSASRDWKRSIRFQGRSILTLIEEGYLQMHATSCSCGTCLHDEGAAGSVRLHHPVKRKRRGRFFLDTEKALKHGISANQTSPTPTVTLPVSGLRELTVVPGLVLGGSTASSTEAIVTPPTVASSSASPAITFANLPLDKAWDRMSEVLVGLERSVSQAHILLEELRERTQQETLTLRQKLLQEKEEAVTQAKLEAQLSSMAKSSEGFLVQVREDDGSQSLQPIMLDSLISSVPSLNPAPPINGVQKKCINCNRESELECSGCHNRAYCSAFCQRRDWASHQGECGRSSPTQEDPLSTVTQTPGYIFMLSD